MASNSKISANFEKAVKQHCRLKIYLAVLILRAE
jgi:hypothetical protein